MIIIITFYSLNHHQHSVSGMCRRFCSVGSSKMYQISLVFCVAVEWNMWDNEMRGISWVMKEIRSRNASSYSLQMLRIWNSRKILLIPSSRVSLVFWISLSRVLPSILTMFACLWWLSGLCSVLELQLLAKLIITIRLQCKYSGLVMPATLLSDQTRVTHQTHTAQYWRLKKYPSSHNV